MLLVRAVERVATGIGLALLAYVAVEAVKTARLAKSNRR